MPWRSCGRCGKRPAIDNTRSESSHVRQQTFSPPRHGEKNARRRNRSSKKLPCGYSLAIPAFFSSSSCRHQQRRSRRDPASRIDLAPGHTQAGIRKMNYAFFASGIELTIHCPPAIAGGVRKKERRLCHITKGRPFPGRPLVMCYHTIVIMGMIGNHTPRESSVSSFSRIPHTPAHSRQSR
jgi:hypothetical protein